MWELAGRTWLVLAVAAVAGSGAVALVLGVPTDVIPNPWFTRMTAVRPEDYVFLIMVSLLGGALLATYLLPRLAPDRGVAAGGLGGGILASLAIGCPVCNKLVVALLGVSGAFTYFGPLQPVLGVASVTLAATALLVRLRAFRRTCALRQQS